MHRTSFALVLAAFVSVGLVNGSAAEAQSVGDVTWGVALGGGAFGATVLGFVIADTASFALDRPFDDGLAALDIVLGTVALAGGITGIAWASTEHGDLPGLVGVSVVALALGAYETSHGIWSIGRLRHERARPPSVCATPLADGAMVSIRGEM